MVNIESILPRLWWLLVGSLAGGIIAAIFQAIFSETTWQDRVFESLLVFVVTVFLMFIDKWKTRKKLLINSFTFSLLMNLIPIFDFPG